MSAKWGQLGATKSGINTQQGHNTGTLVHTALPLACEGVVRSCTQWCTLVWQEHQPLARTAM